MAQGWKVKKMTVRYKVEVEVHQRFTLEVDAESSADLNRKIQQFDGGPNGFGRLTVVKREQPIVHAGKRQVIVKEYEFASFNERRKLPVQ